MSYRTFVNVSTPDNPKWIGLHAITSMQTNVFERRDGNGSVTMTDIGLGSETVRCSTSIDEIFELMRRDFQLTTVELGPHDDPVDDGVVRVTE